MTGRASDRSHVAVIGGGVSGAAVALHLTRTRGTQGQGVTVIEPRPALGRGLAYSTPEETHRVNVPASRMSLLPDEPAHFAEWLAKSGETQRDPLSVWKNGDIYPRRSVFGRYVEEQLSPLVAEGRIRHVQARAERITMIDGGWRIETEGGLIIVATILVLATSHPPPGVPPVLSAVAGEEGFVANPYASAALAGIGRDADVLVIGNGLSSADVVVELQRRGHLGSVTAISRHGLRSRSHPERRLEPYGAFLEPPSSTTIALLRRVRATVRQAAEAGISWHSVFDRLRLDAPRIWTALPPRERLRLVRRLRVYWDVHRFRIAPQVAHAVDRMEHAGRYHSHAARIVAARREGGRFVVDILPLGSKQPETMLVDAIVNTTGPAHHTALRDNPALRSLWEKGHIRPDAYGLGIDTTARSRAINGFDAEEPTLFVVGPLARGAFGELMGLPEVTRHAQDVAAEIIALAARRKAPLRQDIGRRPRIASSR